MKGLFFWWEEALEGGYTSKTTGESIFTQAEILDELNSEIREAVECHFEAGNKPHIVRLHMVKEEMMVL